MSWEDKGSIRYVMLDSTVQTCWQDWDTVIKMTLADLSAGYTMQCSDAWYGQ